ncbi:dispersed gene family protein 1 (DGF-1), putative, partial [Trypanosoma cruzi]
GNTLSTIENNGVESSVYAYAVDVRNGGYIDVENNTMSAANGLYLNGDTTVISAGLLRVADCTFVGGTKNFESSLVYCDGFVTLQGGAQWRVEDNNIRAASVLSMPNSLYEIQLSGSGTTVVVARNLQVDSRTPFFNYFLVSTVVMLPAQFVFGCNLQGEKEVSYDGMFPEEVVVFRCDTCNEDAACYMPGTELVDRGSCSCSCKDGWHGASCLPFEVPDTVVSPLPERAV